MEAFLGLNWPSEATLKANVVKLLADNPKGSVVIQADEKAVADTIIKVMDGAREAGVSAISLAKGKSVSVRYSF